MASRYWVGGTANWDATAGTKWAATSGGAGGQSVPTSADDVFFDAASGAVTVTTSGVNVSCNNLNFTGFSGTIAGTSIFSINGSVTAVAGMSWTSTGTLQFIGSGTQTLTSAGKTLGAITLNAASTTLSLQDALTSSGAITVTTGTFTTNNYNVTATSLSSSNSNTRTINLGSSTVTVSATSPWNFGSNTNLTFNAGTSTVVCSSATTVSFVGGSSGGAGVTFYNLSFTGTSVGTKTFQGVNTFNNMTVSGPASAGVVQVSFGDTQTINGTLSTTGTAGNRRVWFRSDTYGIARNLTINSAPSLTDADFRDIYVIGTAAPISGTRIGDLRGIRGVTASTPKTVYWNLAGAQNWSADAWAATSTGTPSTDNFPLAQDAATFTNAGSVTGMITMDSAVPYTGTVDISGRTSAMTLSIQSGQTIYGDWKNGAGLSIAGNSPITFSGRNTQTITSAGITFNQNGNVVIDSYGGTVQLADALNIGSNTLTVTNGTFDTKNYNVTANTLSSSTSNVRTINLGSSTVTLSATPITFTTSTNLTFNAGTSTINATSASSYTVNGGGVTFYNVTFNNGTGAINFINGANTFRNLTITPPASTGLGVMNFSANQTITDTLTCAGATAVRRIFLQSSTIGTPRTLTVNSLSAQDCDFRDITIAGAAAGSSPTRAGNCGGNTGITFPAAKTVYWNLAGTQSWSATAWAPSSGGTPDINNFPLAQDTAVFDNTGSAGTIQFQTFNIGTIDASARTSAMTLSYNATSSIYGNYTLGSGVTTTNANGHTFSGRGTQTITSAGKTLSFPITIDCATGTVQLADALTLDSTRSLTLTSGTFDAVTYNVTTGLFVVISTSPSLKMGSGTWTLSGTGSVWQGVGLANATAAFYKGTANIVLSNTSTSARTIDGGSASYNKLTIGGATGTSTLTITGNNQFTELASTKTVAHTIALGTTTQTFGAWTVTGTAGNVVTLTGTGTITIAGARVSGVNYLALGTTVISATSPGEFYAGANSTGGTNAILTAAPTPVTRYWVGGTGTWDATTTTNWSATSGGAGGASVPTSADSVIFDNASSTANAAYTVTIGTNAVVRCADLTMNGPGAGNKVTWTAGLGTPTMILHGNFNLAGGTAEITRIYNSPIVLSGSATGRTFTTNGVSLGSGITVNGVGCGWTLGSALDMGALGFVATNGSFATSTYSFSTGSITTNNANSTTLDFGSSTVTVINAAGINFGTTANNRANLTVTAGTSQLNLSSASPTLSGNNQTFYNVSFTGLTAAGTVVLNGANTFNNFTVVGQTSAGVANVSVSADQTINGTLTLSAGTNATMRTFVRSDTIGTTRTLTCAAVASLTDIDFRDITIAGAAAPVSGTRLGDCKGNSGITFPAGKTVYRFGSSTSYSGSNSWSLTAGGAGSNDNFPLAQDTAVFIVSPGVYPSSGGTVTVNAAYNIGTIDMSARTSDTMTLATSTNTPAIYGNWINGTGTTLTGTGVITFAGRGSQTITSAGVPFTQNFTIDTPGGSVTLQDALTGPGTASLTFTSGTFNLNSYNATVNGFSTSNSNTRTLAIGSGTLTLTGTGSVFNAGTSTNFTVTGSGTISMNSSASAKTFAGGGISYSGITLDQGGAGTLTITGNNTFASISNTYKATGATTIAMGTTTQRVGNFTASGEAGRVLTVQGTSASSPATLIYTGAGQAAQPAIDYLTITGVRAYSLDTTWYAGANSTNNGSLGWYFEAGGGGPITVFIIESATGNSSEAAAGTLNSTISELSTGGDAALGGLTYLGTLSESATAADVARVIDVILAAINESASAQDLAAVVASAFSATAAEIAAARDTTQATATFPTALSESAQISDTNSAALNAGAAVSESAAALDAGSSLAVFGGQIAELVIGLDAALVVASTFSASASEIAQARDFLNAPGSIYNVSMSESANLSDSFVGSYLWNPIDDTQTPNWQNINNAQSVTWTTVPDTQNPGWVIIPTSND